MRGCKYFLLKVYEPESLDSMDHIIINPLNFLTGNVASISIFFLAFIWDFFFFAVMKILLPLINKYSLMCRTCISFFFAAPISIKKLCNFMGMHFSRVVVALPKGNFYLIYQIPLQVTKKIDFHESKISTALQILIYSLC